MPRVNELPVGEFGEVALTGYSRVGERKVDVSGRLEELLMEELGEAKGGL